jgi:hypothetical protein
MEQSMIELKIAAIAFALIAAFCAFAAGHDRSLRFARPVMKLTFAGLSEEQDRQHVLNHWAARAALLSAVLQGLDLFFPR